MLFFLFEINWYPTKVFPMFEDQVCGIINARKNFSSPKTSKMIEKNTTFQFAFQNKGMFVYDF